MSISDRNTIETGVTAAKDFHAVSIAASARTRRKTPPPFSLRLTVEERARLEAEAGTRTLGAYIRDRLFDGSSPARRQVRRPVHDEQALAQLLGALGQARIANNLNQLAKAANSGSFLLNADGEAVLREACAAVKDMRRLLMEALGLDASERR